MGKVIKKQLNGMSWWMKTSLVLLLTLATSLFMYQGWYKPVPAQAATVTYGVTVPNVLTTGIDGLAQFPTGGTSVTTAPTVRGNMSTTLTTSGASYRPTTGMTSGTPVTLLKLYSPAYASAQTITAPVGDFAIRGYNASDTWTFHVYSHNPAGVAGNKTLMYSSNTITSGTGGTVAVAPVYTLVNSAMPSGYKLLIEIVYTPGGTLYTPRIYVDGTTTATWCRLTVTETVAATGNLAIGAGTNPANANASQASLNNAIDGFSLAMSSGTGAVTSLTVLGSASFTATNIPTNGVKIYRDNGVVGTYEPGTDTLVSTASTAISGNASTVTVSSQAITTTAANYLVTVDLNAGATVGNAFTATISGAGGTTLGTPVDSDTTSATLTVVAGNVLTIGEGTNPANNTNAQRGSSQAIDGFTLASSTGTASVTAITVTGSANFTATNVGTNGVKIYRDLGTVGTLDGADVLLNTTSPAIVTNATTVPLTAAESVTTAANYLVVVNIAAAATLTNTITANVSGVTQTGAVSVTDSDALSATLTVTAAQTLTIGNGTNPANANIQTGNVASLDSFTMAINTGTGAINSLTLTGSANFTTANIASAAIYADNGVVGTYEAGTDTLVASSYGQAGAVGTITFSVAEPVTTVAKNYLVRVTANGGATVGNTFTGTITGATGAGIVTASDTNSATLTITAGPVSTINSCGGCHGNPPVDGTARNTPAGQFLGDHGKHTASPVSLTCINCHVDNGTSPTGNDHSDGQIQIASPLRGVVGESSTQATKAVTNTPTFGTCTTYCHSQGTSKTTNAGENRTTLSTPVVAAAVWGTTTLDCNGCHNSPPNYTTGTITLGGTAKANSHQGTTHAAQLCTRCHNSVTGTGPYTTTTGHANGLYTVAAANVGYTYAVAGGTCNATGTGCHSTSTVTWGTFLGCVDCHAGSVATSAATQALQAPAVTTRPAIVGDFSLTSRHIRSRTASPAVTNADCIVCHMEGDRLSGLKVDGAGRHGDGRINLRDPDTGLNIKGVTHSGTTTAAGAYSPTAVDAAPVQFKRQLNTATLEADTQAIMVNHCLHCHDAGGAAHIDGRRTGATVGQPFGAAIAANPGGNVLDVTSQLAAANKSIHPVLVRTNNGYTNTGGTRMIAPWNGVAKTATTTTYGPLITCWDCHAPAGTASSVTLISSGVHGEAVTAPQVVALRGSVYVSGATAATNLCLNCHVMSASTTTHGTGSAITSATNSGMTYFQNACYHCHASDFSRTRPNGAGDTHGYNTRGGVVGNGIAFPAVNNGYAFLRSEGWYGATNTYQSIKSIGATTYTPTCGTRTTTGGGAGSCSRTSAMAYTPGGVY